LTCNCTISYGPVHILAILRGLNYNKDVIRKKLEHEDTTRKIKLPKGAKQKESRIEMDRGRKERKLKGDKQGISYAETPEKISKLPKGDRADKIEKYQELGESKKLPDIQLKKDVIAKDMQGNKITLKEGDVFSVYELPKSRYLLEGKESYTVPKNQFQNIKGREFSYCIDFCLFNGANILTLGMSTKKQIDSNINSLSSFSTKK
jgi:hypothetical protein